MQQITYYIAWFNDHFLGYGLVFSLIGAGVYFSLRTRFVQLMSPRQMLRVFTQAAPQQTGKGHISSFQAFAVSTASRVGTGNIAGVAIAVATGGPGAVFWMWLFAFFGAASAFMESTLAQLYKVKEGTAFRGGPAYYMRQGLGAPRMAAIFAVLITLTFAFVFNSVQANTVAQSLQESFGFGAWGTGIVLAAATAVIIFGGLKRIAHFSAVIVPFFALCYLAVTVLVMLQHYQQLPQVFGMIFTDAFSLRKATGGALGAAIMIGARRGLFSNEAGMGSAPNAAATAAVAHPASQGMVQAVSVFVDTLVICSCTAFIVLLSDYQSFGGQGIALTQNALRQSLGIFGSYFISASVLLFAFTSIIGNYYYGQANVQFLSMRKPVMTVFRILVALMVLAGAVSQLQLVWNLADLFMTFMALMNLTAVVLLRKEAFSALADYRRQQAAGTENPVFTPVEKTLGIWRKD